MVQAVVVHSTVLLQRSSLVPKSLNKVLGYSLFMKQNLRFELTKQVGVHNFFVLFINFLSSISLIGKNYVVNLQFCFIKFFFFEITTLIHVYQLCIALIKEDSFMANCTELRVSGTVEGPLLTQKLPICAYIGQNRGSRGPLQ